MNQNEYPAHSEAVLAALPIRATRVLMNGNHTAFFNPKAEDAVRAVSHKVYAKLKNYTYEHDKNVFTRRNDRCFDGGVRRPSEKRSEHGYRLDG
jgi:hypothetical protein